MSHEPWAMGHELPLRIAMVALDFHREGGSEGRTAQLVDRLVAQGHEVHLLGARIRGEWGPGVALRHLHTVEHPHWLEHVIFCRRAGSLLRTQRFDVVHNQMRPFVPGIVTVGGGCHRYYLQDVLPRERGRVRAALKRIGPLHHVLLAMERRGFRLEWCPVIITNSHLSREGILRYYPFPPERVVVAYNGVDAARFHPRMRERLRAECRASLGLGSGEYLILLVGKGFARKGLGPLLRAAATLRGRGLPARVAVVGGGRTTAWRRLAARLGLEGQVDFVGHAAAPERYYAAADVFALPTYFDPFANATLEAMASGLPVVTTRHNGAAELLSPGVDGLVIDRAENVTALVEALGLLADPARRRDMGGRGRETAVQHPWDRPLDDTLRVYRGLIPPKAARGNEPGS